MKRNKELIKAILFYAEESTQNIPAVTINDLPIFQISQIDFIKHCQLIIDYGLIKGKILVSGVLAVESITWEGYEFIDNARESKVWNAATQAAGNLSWKVFTNVLTETAINFAKSFL
jgi:hypothetical protein